MFKAENVFIFFVDFFSNISFQYGNRSFGSKNVPAFENFEIGSISSQSSKTVGCYAQDNGQCGCLFWSPHAFHLYIQVKKRNLGPVLSKLHL